MTTAADPKNFPPLRPKRGAGVELEDTTTFQHPRVRLFPFIMNITASSRRTLSTERLQGPAIIKGIDLLIPFGVDPPNGSLEIGYAPIAVTETAVALTVPRPFTRLTELLDPFAQMVAASGRGILPTNQGTMVRFGEMPLELIVEDSDFFAVLSYVNNGLVAGNMMGHLRVVENLDREALRFFL